MWDLQALDPEWIHATLQRFGMLRLRRFIGTPTIRLKANMTQDGHSKSPELASHCRGATNQHDTPGQPIFNWLRGPFEFRYPTAPLSCTGGFAPIPKPWRHS